MKSKQELGKFRVVICNHLGEFVAPVASLIEGSCWALHVEFIAARRAVLLTKILGMMEVKIHFEGDASLVLAAMKGQKDDYSKFGPSINDLRCFITEWSIVLVSHIQREGNSTAHQLARMGITSAHEALWSEEPPDLIWDILLEEGL
ncbi:uncharacterized protein [Pyrus communis]|uniref:uncharacterized protein n=1 Tax=Pyrus communis TaxID=23211 RepID=UPI0035C070CB